MKNILALSILLLTYMPAYSQITSVDTACSGVPVAFTGPANGITYTWVTDNVNISQTPGPFSTMGLPGLSNACFASTNYDNGTWYTFITDHPNNELLRLTYSGSPNGAYTASSVGIYGSGGQLEGIDIVKDPVSGNWYGLAANTNQVFVLAFGTSLANAPTTTTHNFPLASISWPHQVGLAKYGNDWVAFLGDRNSSIKRLDFGTSLANVPSLTSIPNVGSVSNPCNFAIRKENGNWYMLVTNLINATITRYNFGANITNNAPTGTLLGNPGTLLNLPRSVCIVSDCDQLIAYVLNETNRIIKLDFNSSIANTPTAADMGATGITQQNSLNTYFVDSVMYANIVSFGSNSISRGRFLTFPVYNTTKYYNNTFSHSFSTTGNENMTLYINQGSHMGSESFCKPLVIGGVKILKDIGFCDGQSVVLDASPYGASSYLWNTGATTPSITVNAAGQYWVALTGSGCNTGDTATVSKMFMPSVSIGAADDTIICAGRAATLTNSYNTPLGTSYLWSDGTKNSYINAKAGKHWLTVNLNGCSASDSINIMEQPLPVVKLGNDTFLCPGKHFITQSNAQAANSTYQWNTGNTTDTLTISKAGVYRITVRDSIGCTSSDSIIVSNAILPAITLDEDKDLCNTESLQLYPTIIDGSYPYTITWQDGSTGRSFLARETGTYKVRLTDACGTISDEINVKLRSCRLFFPSAFSPNGDNLNDLARITGDIEGITKYELSIYHRRGQRVFHTTDPKTGWDGVLKGTPAGMDVYFYMIKLTYEGAEQFLKGDITLVR